MAVIIRFPNKRKAMKREKAIKCEPRLYPVEEIAREVLRRETQNDTKGEDADHDRDNS